MSDTQPITIGQDTPLLLRRMRKVPGSSRISTATLGRHDDPVASHMTVVTTQGMAPERHDQEEDAHR